MNAPGTPATAEEAASALKASHVPPEILEVARRLQEAGHAAVLVGGAVRDALLGLPASDWDLATSATPKETEGLFRKTIPTGIEHGTITVMVKDPSAPRAAPRTPVEVTTFRGEGDYVDGRRPSSVTFHRDLHEDLARRDFTVNAFAWDPIREVFTDPFDGLGDLQRRRIRAVGDPAERFAEDGLRTMRAVRLCATRVFTLDPATRAAIGPALPVLDKVSRERVHVELFKLLGAAQPSRGLQPMVETGMWSHVLAEMPEESISDAIAAVDAMRPDPVLRLARLLRPVAKQGPAARVMVEDTVERLRPSKAERRRVASLTSHEVDQLLRLSEPAEIRRCVARLGRDHLDDALLLTDAPPSQATAIREALQGAILSTKELAIAGRDLIAAGLVKPGPDVGRMLESLLERVFDDPTLNDRDALMALARDA